MTAEGHAFNDRCGAILDEIRQAEDAVMALHDRVSGTLRITTVSAFARLQMIALMPEFMALYPELRVELELSEREVDLVGESVDVAIVLSDGLTDESLVARRLAVNKRIICASPEYLAKNGTPTSPDDLSSHNCLTHSSITHFNDWEFKTSDGVRTHRVKGNFHTNSASALHEAVKAGIGIARLATYVVQPSLREGLVVPLLQEHAMDSSSIQLVYPHRRHLSNKVRVFTDFMIKQFSPSPPWERQQG